MRPRLMIVADDLSGAADAAAAHGPFAPVAVALHAVAALPDAEVVAVDTDSRYADAATAAQAVTSAVRTAAAARVAVYKKIDSTLRGNVAVEVAAALRALSATALLSPAFPDTGRTVVNGTLRVNGEVRADVPALVAAEGLRTAPLGLDVVRQGPDAVAAAYAAYRADGVEVVCADAETDADLAVLHAAGDALGPRVLLVGSAGLTRAALPGRRPASWTPPAPPGRVLTVLGSYAPIAAAQRAALVASGEVTLVALRAPFGPAEQRQAAAELAAVAGDALLVPDPTTPVQHARAVEVARALAAVAQDDLRLRVGELAGLMLAGGETARAVLLAAGVSEFRVHGEVEPGVVRATLPALGDLPLITKAGAFGNPGTLDRVRCALHDRLATAR